MTPAEAPCEAATAARTRARRHWTAAAAGLLSLVVAFLWWGSRPGAPVPEPAVAPTIGGDVRTPYAGPLVVTLFRSGTNQAFMESFAGPPYRLVGVEPRAYDVQVGSVVGQGRIDRVDARRSEITPVEVRLVPKDSPR